jgi:D-arabinonate dehydratase
LKIKEVRTKKLRIPLDNPVRFATRTVAEREFTICQLITEDGVEGLGVIPIGDPCSVAAFIDRKLKKIVLGEDIFSYEKLWNRMYREVYRDRMGSAIRAIAAIDIALWDAIGKTLKMPVYKILGGDKSEVQAYASGGYYRQDKGPSELAEEVANYVKKGYRFVKIKVGGAPLIEDIERVRAARQAAGSDVKLMLDANNAYTPHEAIKAGRKFEEFDIFWFEEPVWPDNLWGSREVADALDVPVVSGELVYTRYGFQELFANRAIDIAMPDCTVVGGVTEFAKVVAMAAGYSIPIAPHWNQEVHMHMVGAFSNAFMVEFFDRDIDVRKEDMLYDSYVEPVNGVIRIPDKSGFGRELSEDAIDKFSIEGS